MKLKGYRGIIKDSKCQNNILLLMIDSETGEIWADRFCGANTWVEYKNIIHFGTIRGKTNIKEIKKELEKYYNNYWTTKDDRIKIKKFIN